MPDSSPHGSTGPRTVGLCPEPDCGGEFYMPDPAPGDRCLHGHDGNPPELVIYTMATIGPRRVQPSAEAIRASRRAMSNEATRESWSPIGAARLGLAAAYSIDTPAIHAAGVAEGRAAMHAAIVKWARAEAALYAADSDMRHTWTLFADAIESAHFPSEGTT